MKVIVFPNGDVTFETENVDQAIKMIAGLRNGHAKVEPRKKREPKPPPSIELPVSQPLLETWQWLVANAGEGVSSQEVADALNIKPATAGYRLNKLVVKGLAHTPHRGVYLPGEASE